MSKACLSRIQKDLKELASEPLSGISYHVHTNNIRRMCLILSPPSGPFSGFKLHLDVEFPEFFPRDPPRVSIQTPVPHPNVLGSYLCCDILQHMYTPAYLLKYIFLQLLSFFTSKNVDQSYGGKVDLESYSDAKRDRTTQAVECFSCQTCGFNITFSALPDAGALVAQKKLRMLKLAEGGKLGSQPKKLRKPKVVKEAVKEAEAVPERRSWFEKLERDTCLEILDRLSDQDMVRLTQAYKTMKQFVDSHNLLIRRRLVCFYLRDTFNSPSTVLGIGVSCHEKRKPAVVELEFFSHEAFKDGLRKGITESFTHFLPVALNRQHLSRAMDVIDSCLAGIDRSSKGSTQGFHLVLRTLPALMNSMVLKLVEECDKEQEQEPQGYDSDSDFYPWTRRQSIMRASEKAMEGYCLLFHLFSKLVRSNSSLSNEVQRRVDEFIKDSRCRSKSYVPDLGEFLTYLLVAPKSINWSAVSRILVEEVLARSVLWIFEDRPYLAYMEPESYPSEVRLQHMFEAKVKGLRLVMFQVSFFLMTRPVMGEFDRRYGFPSGEMCSGLMQRIKEIYSVKDYYVCLQAMGVSLDPKSWKWEMIKLLRQAIVSSERRGYHVMRYSPEELYPLRVKVEPRCPAPDKPPREKRSSSPFRFFPGNPRPAGGPPRARRW